MLIIEKYFVVRRNVDTNEVCVIVCFTKQIPELNPIVAKINIFATMAQAV